MSVLGDKIVDLCAGGMHTVALDSDGKVIINKAITYDHMLCTYDHMEAC